jgi:hypothetical protein
VRSRTSLFLHPGDPILHDHTINDVFVSYGASPALYSTGLRIGSYLSEHIRENSSQARRVALQDEILSFFEFAIIVQRRY